MSKEPLSTETDLYYLQVKGYSGNSLLWWRKGRCGYTTEVREAEVFTKEAAIAQHKSRPSEDFPWRKDYIDANLEYSVNSEKVSRVDQGAV